MCWNYNIHVCVCCVALFILFFRQLLHACKECVIKPRSGCPSPFHIGNQANKPTHRRTDVFVAFSADLCGGRWAGCMRKRYIKWKYVRACMCACAYCLVFFVYFRSCNLNFFPFCECAAFFTRLQVLAQIWRPSTDTHAYFNFFYKFVFSFLSFSY